MRSVLRLQAVLKTLSTAILLLLLLNDASTHAAVACPRNRSFQPCRCSERLNDIQIWCSYGNLQSISSALKVIAETLPGTVVDELILENNLLPTIPEHTFSSIKVIRLMFRDNGLQRVSSNWLAGTESTIQEIYIAEPELRILPDESLVTFPKLEALTLSAGLIQKMPAIFGLSRLRYIQIEAPAIVDASFNNFQGLPFIEQMHITSAGNIHSLNAEFLHDLPKLSILNFTRCHLMYIHSKAFQRLPSVTEVTFTENKFTDARLVGMALRDMPILATVRLDHNDIIRLEEGSFVDIPSLRHLYLNDNKITHVQRASFHHLLQLRILDLSNNRIKTIHPEGFLPHRGNAVEELWLNNNQIDQSSTIRMLLDTLPNLRYLDMSNNLLSEISSGTAVNHLHLEILILENNRITRIERESFSGLPSLRELKLKNNFIGYHLGTPYWNLPALKGLDLSRNNFEHIDRYLLNGLPSLRRFDISANELKSVEPTTFIGSPFLEHVNVSKNGLTTLSPLTFSQLQRLFELDVSYNNLSQAITGIPGNTEHLFMAGNNIMVIASATMQEFQNSALKLLDLSDNKIYKIPATSLNTFCTLRTLLLNDNSLQVIDQTAFENLPQLRVLNLANNKLIMVKNDTFKKLQHLSDLNLSKNRLEIFGPDMLSQNHNLRKFDISGNRLTEILPSVFFSNRKIEDLNLSENSLSEFPKAIAGLSTLHTLNLKQNLMTSLPSDVLPSLSSLKELYLSGNKLQQLPSGVFANLANLSMVHLESNEIEQIGTHALRSLPKLLMVKMAKNKINSVSHSAFHDLPVLQSVELQENQLEDVASHAFTDCPNVLMLNMSHNQLNAVEKAGLDGMKTLEALDLSHNRIKRLTSESVKDMNFLVLLKLDNNRICNIEGSPFEKMFRLRTLSLRDNKMTSLAEPTFSKLRSSILYFDIEGNPVKCSCNMLWLQSWLQEDRKRYPGPRCLDGILLREHRMSKYNCDDSSEIMPGCEVAPLLGRSTENTTTTITTSGMTEASSTTSKAVALSSQPKPLPEESDYFDPKFIDVTANSTKPISVNRTTTSNGTSVHTPSRDTASQITARSKVNATKSQPTNMSDVSSAFTFFGMPLPSLNLDSFWNSGKTDKQNKNERPGPSWQSTQPHIVQNKERYVPVVPSVGGFVPMNLTSDDSNTNGHATLSNIPLPQTILDEVDDFLEEIENSRSDKNISRRDPTTQTPTTRITNKNVSAEKTRIAADKPPTNFINEPIFLASEEAITKLTGESVKSNSTSSDLRVSNINPNTTTVNTFKPTTIASPLSEFLVPGGQVPIASASAGKAIVSRVQLHSGPSPQSEDTHSFHLRLAKSSLHSTTTASTMMPIQNEWNESMSWYFANYNRSSIEPYIGRLPISSGLTTKSHKNHPPLLPLFSIVSSIIFVNNIINFHIS